MRTFHPHSASSTIPAVRYEDCPAKSFQRLDGIIVAGRSVYEHSLIVGKVAAALLTRLPERLVSLLLPTGAPLVAAAHDVGKVSPCFYNRICQNFSNPPPELPGFRSELESNWGYHAGVSQAAARAAGIPESVAKILGQHHGFPPPTSLLGTDEKIGGLSWQTERERLLKDLKAEFALDWPTDLDSWQSLVLAGLTTVADWIGSGELFENPAHSWEDRIETALNNAGFIQPQVRHALSFADIFEFAPRAPQEAFIEQIDGEGVYILEAPMGMGKTEAALYAAYRMLEQGLAHGIYFALPTQLTSNKLHERFSKFLKVILTEESPHRDALLLHGRAHLIETEMGEEGRPGGSWFYQKKRALLAPFAVGTLDQALLAAMNVKHGFVRTFGLAGKVVILDEVHTYDAYTGTLLDALVDLLRQLHCTVIVLSATLNHARREELLNLKEELHSRDYPLMTAHTQTVKEVALPNIGHQHLIIRQTDDEKSAIEEALRRAEAGQQVLWIENTVTEAQERYLDMASRAREIGLDCGLLHSRFTPEHRERNEAKWVSCFGKEGWGTRGEHGRLLIGTQVLEQSLDIDADFLISRFAPTDMLLQRLGRLWRHAKTPRPPGASPEAWLIVPELDAAIDNPLKSFGKSARVYSPYVLCRSLEVWQPCKSVDLPTDIRALIEATYADREEHGKMRQWLDELEQGTKYPPRKGRETLRQFARIALATLGATLPEEKAETRYSEQESEDVLLLGACSANKDKKETRITLLSGEKVILPWEMHRLDKKAWRQLADILMRQQVRVPRIHAPNALPGKWLKDQGFGHCFYLGNPAFDESLLHIACVDIESDKLFSPQGGKEVNGKYQLSYRDDIGYIVVRI